MLKILIVEPFFTGSHQSWAEGFQAFSQHEVKILSITGRHWKWRMHSGAVTLARLFLADNYQPDLILATDMLDLPTFLGLTRHRTANIPTVIYFHENQITYPWSPTDPDLTLKRDNQYGFKNFTSAIAADGLFFNSNYHKNSFISALPNFLNQFPDYHELIQVEPIAAKSKVLYLGVNLHQLDAFSTTEKMDVPLLLWNHRWEYDKNPVAFFQALFQLKEEGIPFKLAVLGKNYKNAPAIFKEAATKLKSEIVQFGKVKSLEGYAQWLWKADILPVSNNQDFFGQSVVEAIYCNCFPILPKRLAYPEHIPFTHHATYFYENEEDFYLKIKAAIQHMDVTRKEATQSFVKHYDWRTLAPIYDKQLEKSYGKN